MIIELKTGNNITCIRLLTNERIRYWKFAGECGNMGGSFANGTTFRVEEINKVPGNMWVKILIPGSDPNRYLKISGEEYARNFKR